VGLQPSQQGGKELTVDLLPRQLLHAAAVAEPCTSVLAMLAVLLPAAAVGRAERMLLLLLSWAALHAAASAGCRRLVVCCVCWGVLGRRGKRAWGLAKGAVLGRGRCRRRPCAC
jgi:hypothetical protein